MSLSLSIREVVARARADLRMGAVVVVREGAAGAVVCAAELVSDARLGDLRALGGALDLAITNRRADTLRARSYDGDLARIAVPGDADAGWVRATADPSQDLKFPMKGPYRSRRDGPAGLHRAAIALCKQARLLPSAVVLVADDPAAGGALAQESGLVVLDVADIQAAQAGPVVLEQVAAARVPLAVSEAGRVLVFRPRDGA
ncbi:MAG: GTP cyclohydrolase II, partial [Halocynthiibacter sp.]